MLSDERIIQIVDDIFYSEGTCSEIEHSIRIALAEAAQSPAVPVMREAAGWLCKNKGSRWFTESEDRRDIHISAGWEVTPLFEKPATSITQAELDAKDARIRELEEAIQEIIKVNHYDFRGHEIAKVAIAKENFK